ncbi:MAG: hypothetical protein CME62_12155 [Halobacteriovoraceae bacterium]|nr:hypothetical protein [Halobacteriovoraceae bacterium]|tara:strand:+ start:689 stop:1207 length:519 start_codon:yes stop_codon:yes gene_type:complete
MKSLLMLILVMSSVTFAGGNLQFNVDFDDNYYRVEYRTDRGQYRGHRRYRRHRRDMRLNVRRSMQSIAARTISLMKTIEPYANNIDERELDAIKKEAARLKARSSTRRFRRIMDQAVKLEMRLLNNEDYLLDLLETDRLDGYAIELMEITESISELISYCLYQTHEQSQELY